MFVAASLAELGSAIPSSAGLYHFAAVTAGRDRSAVAFLAGWYVYSIHTLATQQDALTQRRWNFLTWIFGSSSLAAIQGNFFVSMWAVFHDDYVPQRWHVFVVYQIVTWAGAGVVMFAQRLLPMVTRVATMGLVAGVVVTVIVCAVYPGTSNGNGYARSGAVWKGWENQTGWGSDGFVFLAGMLNGLFSGFACRAEREQLTVEQAHMPLECRTWLSILRKRYPSHGGISPEPSQLRWLWAFSRRLPIWWLCSTPSPISMQSSTLSTRLPWPRPIDRQLTRAAERSVSSF